MTVKLWWTDEEGNSTGTQRGGGHCKVASYKMGGGMKELKTSRRGEEGRAWKSRMEHGGAGLRTEH